MVQSWPSIPEHWCWLPCVVALNAALHCFQERTVPLLQYSQGMQSQQQILPTGACLKHEKKLTNLFHSFQSWPHWLGTETSNLLNALPDLQSKWSLLKAFPCFWRKALVTQLYAPHLSCYIVNTSTQYPPPWPPSCHMQLSYSHQS